MAGRSPKDGDTSTRRQPQHGRRHSISSWWNSGISNSTNKKKKKLEDLVVATPAAADDDHPRTQDTGRSSRWDSSKSLNQDEDGSTWTTATGEPRQRWTVVTLSTLLFLMAASIGLVSNAFLLAAEDWQKYTTTNDFNNDYGLGFRAAYSHQQRHLTTLFESFHGPPMRMNTFAAPAASSDHGVLPPPPSQPRRRPKLVIHIGPHDDMATILQADLTFFQDRLALDDYFYLGRLDYPDHDSNDNGAPDSMVLAQHFRDLFQKKCRGRTAQLECVHHLRDLLHAQFSRRTNDNTMLPNLLISDAALLKLFNADHDDDADEVTSTTGHFDERRDNETFAMIHDVLGRDFDIVIIVTYRRFFEWLPTAAKQQHHQEDDDELILSGERTSSSTQWPGKESSGSVVGVVPQLLLPDHRSMSTILDEWSREHFLTGATYATLRNLTAHYSPHFTVKIVHSYNDNQLSLRTNFLCHVVPDAPHSCRASHRDDTIRRMRRHRDDDDDEIRIDARSLWTTTTNREEESGAVVDDGPIPHYPDVFFDALATAAISYIDMDRWDRPTVAQMLRDHYYTASRAFVEEQQRAQRQLLGQSHQYPEPFMTDGDADAVAVVPAAAAATTTTNNNSNNDNPWQLPIVCPSRERLEEILHHSLSLEARMLPKLFQKSVSTHEADFWTVATKTFDFCWIDVQTIQQSDDDDAGGGGGSPWKRHIIETFSAN
jgi:hypothetical protein